MHQPVGYCRYRQSSNQAADFVTRKLEYDNGGVLQALMTEIVANMDASTEVAKLAKDAADVGLWMSTTASLDDRLAGSVPFTTMCAVAVAEWQLARQARVAGGAEKAATSAFFDRTIAAEARGLRSSATAGAELTYGISVSNSRG